MVMPQHILTKSCQSPYEVVVEKLKQVLLEKQLTLFAEINHAEGAASVGQSLATNCLFVFGNPKAGTPLMQNSPLMGLDLPLKILVWEGVNGEVQLSYQNLAQLVEAHGFEKHADIEPLSKALELITEKVSMA